MRGIIWSPSARSDPRRIDRWLDENRSADASVEVLEAIYLRAEFFSDFPHCGRPVGNHKRVLRVISTPYLIVYLLRTTVVEIVRVHHERQDWQTTT